MGLNLPIDCERLNWLERRGVKFESTLDCEELDWLFLPLNKRYLITKIEDVDILPAILHIAYDLCDVPMDAIKSIKDLLILLKDELSLRRPVCPIPHDADSISLSLTDRGGDWISEIKNPPDSNLF